jgi:phosphoglycolate phosphatase-like HAD superfamily hydrolase
LPLDGGFRALFPDLGEVERKAVLTACVEEEEALLRTGGAPAMPGVLETLHELAQLGLSLGIASNCTASYLQRMLDGLGLRDLVDGAQCRESTGIENKADMIERLLADFGTRSALMVGDRKTDRGRGWDNGLPHVHCSFGFAQGDEQVESEGRIESLSELGALLRRRGAWIESMLRELGADRGAGHALRHRWTARGGQDALRARCGARAACPRDPGPCDPDRRLRERERWWRAGRRAPRARAPRAPCPRRARAPRGPERLRDERGARRRPAPRRRARPAAAHEPRPPRLPRRPAAVQERRLRSRHARRTGAREPHAPVPSSEPEERPPLPADVDLVLDGGNPLGPAD